MFSPLTAMLLENQGYPLVDQENVDAFLGGNEFSVLFFPGDAERIAESDDVAVILPELMKVFGDKLSAGVVGRGEAEKALQLRYRFNAFPALVFLKGVDYLGVITRVQDWRDYVRDIAALLESEPSAPPAYAFPDGCNANAVPATDDQSAHGGQNQ